jgi:hypothetical protein
MASGGPADPGSWNRYAYVGGDPIGSKDPIGEFQCNPDNPSCGANFCNPGDPFCGSGCGVNQFFNSSVGQCQNIPTPPSSTPPTTGGPGSGGGYSGFAQAYSDLLFLPACDQLIAQGSGLTGAQLAAELQSASVTMTTDGNNNPATITPTPGGPMMTNTYSYQYQWGYTAGGNIYLNANYFPDPAMQNIQVPGGTQSLLGLVNNTLGTSLNVQQFGALVFLHELMHMVDASSSNTGTIDTNANNLAIISKCGIN